MASHVLKWNSKSKIIQTLRPMFVEYQLNVTEMYLQELKQHLAAKAKELDKQTMLSCNNGGRWSRPFSSCDAGLGELQSSTATPEGLEAIFSVLPPSGRSQIMTMPKTSNLTLVKSASFTNLIRATIAFAYAIGGHIVVPWDIYLPAPDAPRYFGNVDNFSDLFAFVRTHHALLDATVSPLPALHLNNSVYIANHTGSSGDKLRWRFPFPYTSSGYSGPRIQGSRHVSTDKNVCEHLCNGGFKPCVLSIFLLLYYFDLIPIQDVVPNQFALVL